MDYENYDNDTNPSDEDYSAFVEWLSKLTASELCSAKGQPEQQKQILCRYYKRGERANLTAGELVDFLGISSPSIFDMANYTEAESDAAMQISDGLTDDDLDQTFLPSVA